MNSGYANSGYTNLEVKVLPQTRSLKIRLRLWLQWKIEPESKVIVRTKNHVQETKNALLTRRSATRATLRLAAKTLSKITAKQ
jgi:hypothetical protein